MNPATPLFASVAALSATALLYACSGDSDAPPSPGPGTLDAGPAASLDAGNAGHASDAGPQATDAASSVEDGGDAAPASVTDAGLDGSTFFGTLDSGACDTQTAWAQLVQQPLAPPSLAGIDWATTTIDQANVINCQGSLGGGIASGDQSIAWGNDEEVWVSFDPHTRKADYIELRPGYVGGMTFKSRTGGAYGDHSYRLAEDSLTRDNAAITIDWTTPNAAITELYDAYLATFSPGSPAASNDCVADKSCVADSTSMPGDSIMGFVLPAPLDFYAVFDTKASLPFHFYAAL